MPRARERRRLNRKTNSFRSEGDHDQGEGGVGGVEAVGPVDDEPDAPVESFVAGVVHSLTG